MLTRFQPTAGTHHPRVAIDRLCGTVKVRRGTEGHAGECSLKILTAQFVRPLNKVSEEHLEVLQSFFPFGHITEQPEDTSQLFGKFIPQRVFHREQHHSGHHAAFDLLITPPGEVIEEELEIRRITEGALLIRSTCSVKHVSSP